MLAWNMPCSYDRKILSRHVLLQRCCISIFSLRKYSYTQKKERMKRGLLNLCDFEYMKTSIYVSLLIFSLTNNLDNRLAGQDQVWMEPHILDHNRHIRPCASPDLLYMTTGFHLHIMINEKPALLCNSISRVLNQLSTALLKLMGDRQTYACTGARRSRLLEKNLGRNKWRYVRIS